MPWQEEGFSSEEEAFRKRIEERKTRMLETAGDVRRPVFLGAEEIGRARSNIDISERGSRWLNNHKETADFVLSQPAGFVEAMISERTPTNPYGFTCPNCVGKQSQEAAGTPLIRWTARDPDKFECRKCGQSYPDPKFPETRRLQAPRTGEVFTYYENEEERANPNDRSGKLAWHWVGYPVHISWTGILREEKASYMMSAVYSLAMAYRFTGEPKYAQSAREVFVRLAQCYRKWLYHDYWDTIADCDPMYAAWRDKALPLEWKRHLCTDAYTRDTPEKASMLQTYWGCGRIHPSTDGIGRLKDICIAYDSVVNAVDKEGAPLWSDEDRAKVERDLLLEWVLGGEPFVGGENRADSHNNKAPRVYHAQAAVGVCLGIPSLVDTALRGYDAVRDNSFLYDGFSRESPAYTNMYLAQLVEIPDTLAGYGWPEEFAGREGRLDPFADDERLELMFRAVLDQLHPNGTYLPLSDTRNGTYPSANILEIGLNRFPEFYSNRIGPLLKDRNPSAYSLFNLDPQARGSEDLEESPEIYFPAWMNAILRHGSEERSTVLSLALSPEGGHRHKDNLALYYSDSGRTVLGDLGYVGDMPVNSWIKSTKSHSLVVVDDSEQLFGGEKPRTPSLRLMATSPEISVVEAESRAYEQCGPYRRTVILLKGPASRTIAVDRFRVSGGKKHAFRIFSELASSDAATATLEFEGVDLPPEPPLPNVGSSLAQEDIFGLRDERRDDSPQSPWTATWKEGSNKYRLWMLSPCESVIAANGPGQRSLEEAGRRVRYVDAIREGESLESDFLAVHEPSNLDGTWAVRSVERLEVPSVAGPGAVALRLDTEWGIFEILLDFEEETRLDDRTFKGRLGVVKRSGSGISWLFGCEASTLEVGSKGFTGSPPLWRSDVSSNDAETIFPASPLPPDWPETGEGVIAYLVANDGSFQTGFPVEKVADGSVTVSRFPLPKISAFELPAVRFKRFEAK
jgi:hypothetical protein